MSALADSTSVPSSNVEQFRADGYTVVRHAIGADTAALIARYALLQRNWPGYYTREDMFRAANGRYADALSESLLLDVQPQVEHATGLTLLPCYSYLRIYAGGAILQKHTDRPSCEISTSLTLGFEAPALWPLCAETRGAEHAVELAPGDMLVYRGADLPHWRPVFEGEYWVQTFLHYVDASGEYTDFKFDGRERIGPFDKLTMQRKFQRPASAGRNERMAAVPGDGPCPCGSGLRFRDCHGQSSG